MRHDTLFMAHVNHMLFLWRVGTLDQVVKLSQVEVERTQVWLMQ